MAYSQVNTWMPPRQPENQPFGMNSNPWAGFLEDQPKAGYFSWLNRNRGLSPNQNQFFQGNFDEIYNQYLGQLGSQAQQGMTPDLQWGDYLGQQDPMNLWGKMTPRQRGDNAQRFAPGVRWMR